MKRQPVDNYAAPTVHMIDVSHHQGAINWSHVADSDFANGAAIIRTGDGKDRDRRFAENWRGAQSLGLRLGFYRYFRAVRGGIAQARLDLEMLDEVGGLEKDSLPPILDYEAGAHWQPDGKPELPTDLVVEEMLAYLDAIEAAFGRVPMIYTGQKAHWALSQAEPELAARFARYPLWIASYGTRALMPVNAKGEGFPWPTWQVWQYSSKGQVPGIKGDCDMNRFRGDCSELDRFCAARALGNEDTDPAQDLEGPYFGRMRILTLAESAKAGGDLKAANALRKAYEELMR